MAHDRPRLYQRPRRVLLRAPSTPTATDDAGWKRQEAAHLAYVRSQMAEGCRQLREHQMSDVSELSELAVRRQRLSVVSQFISVDHAELDVHMKFVDDGRFLDDHPVLDV